MHAMHENVSQIFVLIRYHLMLAIDVEFGLYCGIFTSHFDTPSLIVDTVHHSEMLCMRRSIQSVQAANDYAFYFLFD